MTVMVAVIYQLRYDAQLQVSFKRTFGVSNDILAALFTIFLSNLKCFG